MGRNYKICPKCNSNEIKGRKAKQCIDCRIKEMKISKPYNYKGACLCNCGNKKAWHANKCRACNTIGLADCISCGDKLSVYKNSNQYNTGLCQKCYKGDKSKRWNEQLSIEERQPFRTKMPQYYEWRNLVFSRDNYTCQKCGDNKGGNLCSHHIENYSEVKDKRFEVSNGITLCEPCHIRFHKENGWKNNNEKQIKQYLKQMLQLTQ